MGAFKEFEDRKRLYEEIKYLKDELVVAIDDVDYYKTLLMETRTKINEIHVLIGAKYNPVDEETVDEMWIRACNEIIEVINA